MIFGPSPAPKADDSFRPQILVRNRKKMSTGLGNRIKQAFGASDVGPLQVIDAHTITRNYVFDPNFIGFSGHFPTYPILPAFVQILTALELAKEQIGEPVELAAVRNAKFLQEVQPDQEISVQCRERLIDGRAGCDVTIRTGDKIASKFVITFTKRKRDPGR